MKDSELSQAHHGPSTSTAQALQRIRRAKLKRLLNGGVATSAVATLAVQGLGACAVDDEGATTLDQTEVAPNVPAPGDGKADWAQYEGERNTDMVVYRGEYWTEQSDCNTRAGCMSLDLILKVFVKPVPAANLDAKRVGVVFRLPSWEPGRTATAMGSYYSSYDGMEEWHVRIRMRQWDGTIIPVFNAWYQDGLGHTYYDDNMGEFHAADGWGQAIHQLWWNGTDVQVNDSGVSGQIVVRVADLDWDKELDLVWTTNDWQDVHISGLGSPSDKNAWFWVEDSYYGRDVFRMNLNIPGSYEEFEYAIVYRHGVTNNAIPYEFWDNAGGYNYTVTRGGPPGY